MIFPLRLRALLVSNSLLIHPVAKNGPRPLSLTRKNTKGPAMFWGHSQNFVFGILRSLELRTQITQFLDTCWIFFDVRLMLVDFSCKPSLAFCVWDSLHAAAGRIRLHISKFLAELGLAAMEFLQQMALCIEQHIFEYILIHSLIHIWCILFDSKIYLKNMICIHIYIHTYTVYIYILMILSDAMLLHKTRWCWHWCLSKWRSRRSRQTPGRCLPGRLWVGAGCGNVEAVFLGSSLAMEWGGHIET